MNLHLLQEASLATVIHLVFALSAFALGAFQLLRPKGTQTHRVLVWIKEVWPTSPFLGYSPIHLLSLFVLSQLVMGIYFARKGNIQRHKQAMTYTYAGGLIIAGAFTFLPGRLMYQLFFS